MIFAVAQRPLRAKHPPIFPRSCERRRYCERSDTARILPKSVIWLQNSVSRLSQIRGASEAVLHLLHLFRLSTLSRRTAIPPHGVLGTHFSAR